MSTRLRSRLLLGAGSLASLAISPVFALAYYPAFGGPEEAPPGWLADLAPRFTDWGWLGSGDPEGLYSTYGMWYFGFLTLTFLGLVVLLRSDLGDRWTTDGWGVVVAGLALAAVGTLGDYSGIEFLESLFLLELLGALVIAGGTVMIGIRLWRGDRRTIALIGLVGPLSLVLGSVLLGHLPSGPLSIILMGGVALAVTGARWDSSLTGQGLTPDA